MAGLPDEPSAYYCSRLARSPLLPVRPAWLCSALQRFILVRAKRSPVELALSLALSLAGEDGRGEEQELQPPRPQTSPATAMERAPRPAPTFSALFTIGPVQEALFATLSHVELLQKVRTLNKEGKQWVDDELLHAGGGGALGRGVRAADVVAGIHVALLHRFAAVPGTRVQLMPAVYELVAGDEEDAAHLLNGLRPAHPPGFQSDAPNYAILAEARAAWRAWKPQWRLGYGPLELAAGVTIVGQDGVELDCEAVGVQATQGARIVSVHFPQGMVLRGRSLTIEKWISAGPLIMEMCTATGRAIDNSGSSQTLVMEDCRVIFGGQVKLMDCVVRNNGTDGLTSRRSRWASGSYSRVVQLSD